MKPQSYKKVNNIYSSKAEMYGEDEGSDEDYEIVLKK